MVLFSDTKSYQVIVSRHTGKDAGSRWMTLMSAQMLIQACWLWMYAAAPCSSTATAPSAYLHGT